MEKSEVFLLSAGSSERNNGKAVDEGAAAEVLQDEFVADAAQKPSAAGRQLHLLLLPMIILPESCLNLDLILSHILQTIPPTTATPH